MMKKVIGLIAGLAMVLCLTAACGGENLGPYYEGKTKIGIVGISPDVSDYVKANMADMENLFLNDKRYVTQLFYSKDNSEQLKAADGMVTDRPVDRIEYLLISAIDTEGWEGVLNNARDAGIKVFLFDRVIDVPDNLYEAAYFSDTENREDPNALQFPTQANRIHERIQELQRSAGNE